MKKFLQFAGIISLALAAVAFILMMATHAIEYKAEGLISASAWYSGAAVIFGKGPAYSSGAISILGVSGSDNYTFEGNLAVTALLSWIFVLAAMIILLVGIVLPLLKINALQKFAGLLNLIAVCLLVLGGILMFFTLLVFSAANEWNSTDGCAIGAGWIIAAILYIVAGVVAIMPAAADFIAKKK